MTLLSLKNESEGWCERGQTEEQIKEEQGEEEEEEEDRIGEQEMEDEGWQPDGAGMKKW